jgi:hypothetical protein
MLRIRIAAATLMAFALASPALADDSASFVVRLGQDTTSVEHYTRTASQVVVDQVGRAPRTMRRHFVYDFGKGEFEHMSMVVTPPGATAPTQTIEAKVAGDSLQLEIKTGAAPVNTVRVPFSKGLVVAASSSPWSAYESQTIKLAASKGDSLRTNMYFLGAQGVNWLSLHKLGRDSVSLINEHQDQMHLKVDKTGHILGVLPIAGTGKVSAERVASLDLETIAASFAAREKQGAGMGVLSTRDTVKVDAGGAAVWIDYGRPAKRGRVVFGGVVPFGEVWRTGANAATQFKTDKPLDFGGVTVPAGFYTLWTVPSPNGWKLIVNSETGQWGTEHKAEKDLFTIPLAVSTLPESLERFTIGVQANGQGGTITLDWDTTRASAAFTVKP